ncbi:sphingosine 1-phosphate receptor 1 isoform X2 [Notolabrus celidotus]|uniref:sphingosine 1-phosphate receptor 1 isoform X2 n=1 Tax=Notolabrus celidotus TaxID=1203425 RepID=UPI00148F609F|nr:sphingosine 1-phosphate receptor 1 isoform X2 [Notolabrus celidotus]
MIWIRLCLSPSYTNRVNKHRVNVQSRLRSDHLPEGSGLQEDLMALVLLFTLLFCCLAAEARSSWSEKPSLIVSSYEIKNGKSVKFTCTVPIDYGGGECRLYRDYSRFPQKVTRESGYLCVFHLSSAEVLGTKSVGSTVSFTCDYHLQQYTSVHSDSTGVTVSGSSPSPRLSVSRRILSPTDSVEATCSPPVLPVHSCHFYRDDIHVAEGSCSRNLTGQQLAIWEKPTLLLPVNLTCRYYPKPKLEIRSEPSNQHLLLVLDANLASNPMDCRVQVEHDRLEGFGDGSWTSVNAEGLLVNVQVSNRSLTTDKTWDCVQAITSDNP